MKSIAVLPFVNMSADPENEYFSDGITEEIINALTTIQGLKVIARTSSFAFKGKNIDIRAIGNQLGVTTILEGSVRKAQARVRVTAQLIRTDDGSHIWSKNFDRQMEDIFAVQDEISLLIADRIRENFGHLEIAEHLVVAPNIDAGMYQNYLKGRYYINKLNTDDIKHGISILEEIVQQKPDFALAHADIHYGYNSLAAGGLVPVEEALTTGKKHLDRAMELDSNLPECYHSLGWHSLNKDWDFRNATRYLTKAIELRPGYADAHQKLFINLALEGNIEASFEHINIALQLDPLSALSNYFMGYYYYIKEDAVNSQYYLEKSLELEPAFIVSYSIYSLSLILQNRADDIFDFVDKIPSMAGAELEQIALRTVAYSSIGDVVSAHAGLQKMQEASNAESRERIRFFIIHSETLLGNYERAFDVIEEGIANREPLMTLLKADPILKPLHQFKQFQSALRKIYALSDLSLPEEQKTQVSFLSDTEIATFLQQLEHYMNSEQLFLDAYLSLRDVADKLHLHPNKLSWLLNEHVGKNFNEYINSLRVETFKTKVLDPANSHVTLIGLAYESGFNSKSVFNTFFKKKEGMTPRDWVKSQKR
jgi:TolB-like protein/AraC-like DNA-binding protein/TPR repeat protein